jgi:cytochrome P450
MSPTSPARFEPRSADTWRDPFSMYRALRDQDPVHEVHDPQGDYWALSRFEDVMRSVIDARRFSSAQGLTMTYGEMGKLGVEAPIVMMDPPKHTKLRKLSIKRFTPKQVQAIEAVVRRFVVERVEELREAGEGDVVARLFKPLPSLVVGHFLGVPAEDQGQFDGWTDGIVAANARGDILNATDTVGQMFGYFAGLIEKRRQDPVDDMISTLVHAEIDSEPVPMTQVGARSHPHPGRPRGVPAADLARPGPRAHDHGGRLLRDRRRDANDSRGSQSDAALRLSQPGRARVR